MWERDEQSDFFTFTHGCIKGLLPRGSFNEEHDGGTYSCGESNFTELTRISNAQNLSTRYLKRRPTRKR
jgi:hypothetical protein